MTKSTGHDVGYGHCQQVVLLVQGMRGALNAPLYRTGDQSRDFVVVLATNRPGDLDPAIVDRMDEALEFPLPGLEERARILAIYLESYILKAGTAAGTYSHAHAKACLRQISDTDDDIHDGDSSSTHGRQQPVQSTVWGTVLALSDQTEAVQLSKARQ